jgi:oxalate decarboxylase
MTGLRPQPIRGRDGASVLGPRNLPLERENLDLLSPPRTDSRTVPNLKYSFAAAHNRLLPAGWAREVTTRELPIATELAGVDMRLEPGGVREMHWHKEAEWGYMLAGRSCISAVDQDGRNFIDEVGEGDIWNFPAGIPHSIQGLEQGCEFLLVFDDGDFSENETFLLTDWFKHTPPAVLAKNFGVAESAFENAPVDIEHERYIFPASIDTREVASPAGVVPNSFSYRLSAQEPVRLEAGQVRIVDSTSFPAATTIAAALVEVEPGGLRELHWHPNTDEWQYYISGRGRMTVFASGERARTFDYQAGDVGYVPFAMGHYVENTGDETLRFLEMFRSDRFADISLAQWMALTPPELVRAHLNLDPETVATLSKEKAVVIPSRPAHRELDALPEWPAGTIAVLSTLDDQPHAIPVTAPVRAGDRRLLLSLHRRHASLDRLRKRAQVALTVLAENDEAFTARGRACVVEDPMEQTPEFAAVMIDVDHLDDHRQAAERVASGVGVEWTDPGADEALSGRVDALSDLAHRLG